MTETDAPIVWQRVPQGWIELVAFDDDTVAAAWWEAHLSPAREWLDAGTAAAMTRAFDTARETLRTSPYAVAGIFPYLDGEPTVFFLGTTILPAPDDRDAARTVASLVGLVRFGDDMRTESFVALDGRVGSASLGRATLEDGTIVGAITGEIPLPDAERGTVFVLALSLDPDRLEELGPYAALALDSTRLLAPGDAPGSYPGAAWTDAEAAREPVSAGITAVVVAIVAALALVPSVWLLVALHRSGRRLARTAGFWAGLPYRQGRRAATRGDWFSVRFLAFSGDLFLRVLTSAFAGLAAVFTVSSVYYSIAVASSAGGVAASVALSALLVSVCVDQFGGVQRIQNGYTARDPWTFARRARG